MPIEGLASAPEVFQHVVEQLVGEMKRVECAVDDILIHVSSKSEVQATIKKVLQIFKDAGFSLNNWTLCYTTGEVRLKKYFIP